MNHPVNEPILGYFPGSQERIDIQTELDRQMNEVLEIPCIINGKEVFTGTTTTQVIPHNHSHVIAKVHLAGKDEMEAACKAAVDAQKSWIDIGLNERCAIFERCADLLAGEWRMKVNASTMLNQSKTVYQAEIDAACELIDFWRFNCHYARGFHDELQSTIKMADNNREVNALIITGAGDFFCAGGDLNGLKTRRSMSEDERYDALRQLNGTIQAIFDCSKPIISAIEGGAAGAGVSLAMACDLVVMSEHTFFSLAYVKIGLTPDGNATKFLSETMPRQMLAEMAMIGGKIDASRLYQIGAINVLSQKGNAKETALELSKNFDNLPKNSISRIKKLSRSAYGNNFSEQLQMETELMVKSMGDKESIEGIDAFLEKREPDYKKLRK